MTRPAGCSPILVLAAVGVAVGRGGRDPATTPRATARPRRDRGRDVDDHHGPRARPAPDHDASPSATHRPDHDHGAAPRPARARTVRGRHRIASAPPSTPASPARRPARDVAVVPPRRVRPDVGRGADSRRRPGSSFTPLTVILHGGARLVGRRRHRRHQRRVRQGPAAGDRRPRPVLRRAAVAVRRCATTGRGSVDELVAGRRAAVADGGRATRSRARASSGW